MFFKHRLLLLLFSVFVIVHLKPMEKKSTEHQVNQIPQVTLRKLRDLRLHGRLPIVCDEEPMSKEYRLYDTMQAYGKRLQLWAEVVDALREVAGASYIKLPNQSYIDCPLHAAVKSGLSTVVSMLLERGADKNWKDHLNRQASYYIHRIKDEKAALSIAQLLITTDQDCEALTWLGENVVELAYHAKRYKLLEYYATVTPLTKHILSKYIKLSKLPESKDGGIALCFNEPEYIPDMYAEIPLLTDLYLERLDLWDCCLRDFIKKVGTQRTQPLHKAVRFGFTVMVALLLERGASKDWKDHLLRVPSYYIHCIQDEGAALDIAKLLVTKAEDLKALNGLQETVISLAEQQKKQKLIEYYKKLK